MTLLQAPENPGRRSYDACALESQRVFQSYLYYVVVETLIYLPMYVNIGILTQITLGI